MTKVVYNGSAVEYALSIPSTSLNKDGAIKYIHHMRNKTGGTLDLVLKDGIVKINRPVAFHGNKSAVPSYILNQPV